jgi:hypothetical protein
MKIFNRKTLLVLIIIALIPYTSYSQSKGSRLGILFGIGQAKTDNAILPNQYKKIALGGGVGYNYQFNKIVGIYGNVLFTSKGTKSRDSEISTGNGSTNYSYRKGLSFYAIEVPIMPKLSIGLHNFHFKVFAGPSINFNIHANEDKEYDDHKYDQDNGYKDKSLDVPLLEYSFVWGGGIEIETVKGNLFFLEGRKQHDLNLNVVRIINNTHYFNGYYMFSLGYLFKIN